METMKLSSDEISKLQNLGRELVQQYIDTMIILL